MLIGSHVSITGGLLGAAREAAGYGASTMMVYTGGPQNTARKPLEKMMIDEGKAFMAERGISDIVVHAPYIINLASPEDSKWQLAKDMLRSELLRTDAFGARWLVAHPGAFTSSSMDEGIKRVAAALDEVLGDDTEATVCLETMAGKGSEIGGRFEELADIRGLVKRKERVGVCFDTCHTHDAGYDVVDDLDGVMAEFDRVVGVEHIKVFHLNGSLNPRGARKDRHANIGAGEDNPRGRDYIGPALFRKLARAGYAQGRPLILETPWVSETENLYREEIEMIRRL